MAKFCTNCGAPLSEDAKFCEECGTPVEQGESQANRKPQVNQGAPAGQSTQAHQGPHVSQGTSVNQGPQNGPMPQVPPNSQVPPGAQAPHGQQYGPGQQIPPGPQMSQGPRPQPGPQGYPGPQYQPKPPKKSKTGLIVGLIIAAGAAVALILFLLSPFGKNLIAKITNRPAATSAISAPEKASSQVSPRSSSQNIAGASSAQESSKTSSQAAPQSASSAQASSGSAQSAPASSAKPAQTDFSSISTTEEPEYNDFLWFWEDVYFNGAPAAKEVQKDFSALTGSWKALCYIDPGNKMDLESYDLSTYTFEGTRDFVTLKTQRHTIYDLNNGAVIDASNEGSSTWHGKFENGAITFDGPGSIRIDEIYTYNGREYALGHYYYPSGENGPLALVRP